MMRTAAREALIELWCRDGFKVPSRRNRPALMSVKLATSFPARHGKIIHEIV
jgi:hypothetical protein